MSEASNDNWIRSLFPFVVMCFGGFMALLDIQIVASSLQHIGGGLSAAQDEISWVQTAYLIAEIIVIPLSGWLTRVFSTRWLFTASAAGFTATPPQQEQLGLGRANKLSSIARRRCETATTRGRCNQQSGG